MKKTGILVTLCCAFALCMALVGCGGSGASEEEAAKAAFTGSWTLVGMTQEGQETSADDIETLSSLGLEVSLNLKEDSTAELVLFGESMEGTWKAESQTAGTVTLQDDAVAMTIEGDKLTMVENDSSLTFQKADAQSAASSASAASAEGEDAAADAGEEAADETDEESAEEDA